MFKKVFVILALLVAVFAAAAPADAALPNQRTDLRVLLLSATGNEPTTGAWETTLRREGVPFDEKVVGLGHDPLTADSFSDTLPGGIPHAKYDAVVIATGGLVLQNDLGQYVSALSNDEWSALRSFEATYGIREVTAFAYPTPEFGLNYPTASGDLAGVVGSLTSAGATVFPYLKGSVPIDQGAYGYQATPLDSSTFKTLVSGPGGSSLLGVMNNPDGRQQLVSTVDSNAYQLHGALLRHGMLSWATRGVFLGYERNYLDMQVDDVFLGDDRWDVNANVTTGTNPIRMTATDVTRLINWQTANSLRLDMVFNGDGSVDAGSKDRLTKEFLDAKNINRFGWINHTYSHVDFDDVDDDPSNGLQPADLATITSEIQKNIDWAKKNRVPIDKTELVTGEHSGLANPNMPAALTQTGIKWVGDDASRHPDQRQIGPALTVPRHPTNVYYNTSTRQEQLDEYNYIYLPPALGGACQDSAVTTCFSQPATWNEYVSREGRTILQHILANDPLPHYAHQSNLAADGILYSVLDDALSRYRSYLKPVLQQPTHAQVAMLLARDKAWTSNSANVSAYIQNGKVTLQSSAASAVPVPITGAAGVGSLYGGSTSGYVTLAAGGTLQYSLQPGVGL
jgi:hypothetical protein